MKHFAIWFKDEATYARFQKLCPDMTKPYEEWVDAATNQVAEVERTAGIFLARVEADADEFAAFCKVNSYSPDTRARSRYAAVKGGQSGDIGGE